MTLRSTTAWFKQLVPISNPSGNEAEIRTFIQNAIASIGFDKGHVDKAGNLLVRIPGNVAKPTILLSAHMDSVPPCQGIEPIEDTAEEKAIIRSSGKTILGADDKSGIATILALLERLKAEKTAQNAPLELLFSVQEEVGLLGAKAFDIKTLRATMGFVLDGEGSVGDIFAAAASQKNLLIEITGKAAHAGLAPEEGTSATLLAAKLVSQLPQGRLNPLSTVNIGLIEGGSAMNVVAPSAVIRGEARSHHDDFLEDLMVRINTICRQIQHEHPQANVVFTPTHRYTGYGLPKDHPAVLLAKQACETLGIKAKVTRMSIGSDAHILNHAGLPTIVLGMGFHYSHSLGEHIFVDELEQVTELVWTIINA